MNVRCLVNRPKVFSSFIVVVVVHCSLSESTGPKVFSLAADLQLKFTNQDFSFSNSIESPLTKKEEKNCSFIDFDVSRACLVSPLQFHQQVAFGSPPASFIIYSAACRLLWSLQLAIYYSFCSPALPFRCSSSPFHFRLPY